jgi:hypothetical protein
MKTGMLALWLVPLLAACAAAVPQADPAPQGQPAPQAQQLEPVVVHDYALDSITGSHLKRRRGISAMNGQTLTPAALEDWQRLRPNPKGAGGG